MLRSSSYRKEKKNGQEKTIQNVFAHKYVPYGIIISKNDIFINFVNHEICIFYQKKEPQRKREKTRKTEKKCLNIYLRSVICQEITNKNR